jgi:hypothetical protein
MKDASGGGTFSFVCGDFLLYERRLRRGNFFVMSGDFYLMKDASGGVISFVSGFLA